MRKAELARFPERWCVETSHHGQEAEAPDEFNSAASSRLLCCASLQMEEKAPYVRDLTDYHSPPRIFAGLGNSGITSRITADASRRALRDHTSDNTETDLAISRVGGVSSTNAWIRTNGYGEGMVLTQTTADLFAKYGALPAGASNTKTISDRDYWLGAMTPRATGRMLEGIQRCSEGVAVSPVVATQARCTDMMRMMRAQQSGARRLPHFLNVPVAHKTGDFPPCWPRVGLISRGPDDVVSVFSKRDWGPLCEARRLPDRWPRPIVDTLTAAGIAQKVTRPSRQFFALSPVSVDSLRAASVQQHRSALACLASPRTTNTNSVVVGGMP